MCPTTCCSMPRTPETATGSSDTLVIVRPPTSHQSLALQLQLIHPALPATNGSSSPPARRKMTPLYSLHIRKAHSTSVTDAATDERVAKFLKRGLEVGDLAILDLVQASNPPPCSADLARSTSTSSASPPPSFTDPFDGTTESQRPSLIRKLRNLAFQQSAPAAPAESTPPKTLASFDGLLSFGLAHALPRLPTLSLDPTPSPSYTFVVGQWLREEKSRSARSSPRFEWRREEVRGGMRGRSGTVSSSSTARDLSLLPTPPGSPHIRPSVMHRDSLSVADALPLNHHRRTLSTPSADAPVRPELGPSSLSYSASTSPTPSLLAPSSRSRSSSMSSDPSSPPLPSDTLVYKWTLHLLFGDTSSKQSCPLATLTPTPSHPRLVAHVSVPSWSTNFNEEEVGMSVEEVEECMSVLCLWLTVKESSGGEGKSSAAGAEGGWWRRRASK